MRYYVTLLGLGDNLISLFLLEQLEPKVNVLGTKHTKNVAQLMGIDHNQVEIDVVFNDIPAFYDIKKQGVVKAVKDFLVLIRKINKSNIQELIFEKKDFRSSLIALFTKTKIYYPSVSDLKVYKSRAILISDVYKQPLDMKNYTLSINSPKVVVINPLTRVELRNIKCDHLENIISILNNFGYNICLIDIEKKYTKFEQRVTRYLSNTTLDDVKQLIKECDLYIGGDSFLVHLAYYLKTNYFIVFYRDNDDFLPPNILDNFYLQAHKCSDFKNEINIKFKKIGLIK